ncbi:hypothetical protein CBL_13624 [Carabus blaptoides fortunei]
MAEDLADEEMEEIFAKPTTIPYISARPIQCPISDCRRVIAANCVGTHFKHEHHRIPKYYVTYDMTKQIQLNLERLAPGKTHCSAVLLLAGMDEDPKTMHIDDFVVIPVLTTKLKCSDVDIRTDYSNVPTCRFTYDLPSTSNAGMKCDQAPRQRYCNDLIAIWLSTHLAEDKECCITGTHQEKTAKYHYCGAVHSIRDSNEIEDVLPKGNHLMVFHSNLMKNPEKGLYLFNVTVMQNLLSEPCS